jgi:hypothetical protein
MRGTRTTEPQGRREVHRAAAASRASRWDHDQVGARGRERYHYDGTTTGGTIHRQMHSHLERSIGPSISGRRGAGPPCHEQLGAGSSHQVEDGLVSQYTCSDLQSLIPCTLAQVTGILAVDERSCGLSLPTAVDPRRRTAGCILHLERVISQAFIPIKYKYTGRRIATSSLYPVGRCDMTAPDQLASTSPTTSVHRMRITQAGKLTSYVKFALKHLRVSKNDPLPTQFRCPFV